MKKRTESVGGSVVHRSQWCPNAGLGHNRPAHMFSLLQRLTHTQLFQCEQVLYQDFSSGKPWGTVIR